MRLYVYVLEGKDLPVKDVYVRVRVGKLKSKTRTLRNSMNPIWNEEFVFSVHDMDQEVVVSVFHHDDNSRLFTGSGNLMGRIRIPVWYVAAEDNRTLTPTWFPLEKTKTGKFITKDRGFVAMLDNNNASSISILKVFFHLMSGIVSLLTLLTLLMVFMTIAFASNMATKIIIAGIMRNLCFKLRDLCLMHTGKILLTMSLHGKMHDASTNHLLPAHSNVNIFYNRELEGPCASSHDISSCKAPYLKIAEGKHLVKAFASRLEKLFNKDEETSRSDDSSEISSMLSDYEDCIEGHSPTISFEEALEMIKSKDNGHGMLDNLLGGIILDQSYIVSPKDLNNFLFAPDPQFRRDLAALQGTTDVQEGPWTWKSADKSQLTRLVTYTKAATKLVKAVQATEEQNYIRANGREFAIFISVSTPEVPYGGTFKIELLYKIMPGPELPSGVESSHLVVSWGINFHQSTMMKGMIEGGARQGLKESFDQFAHLLEQNFKVPDSMHASDKDHLIRSLQTEHQSDRRFALDYFWNFTIISTFLMIMYVFVHILFCEPSKVQGLEFSGLDLPDSFGQLITSGILVLQLERVYDMISHFIQARLERGSDHGVKAQGDGWVLTVALVEGTNLASLDPTGFSDPYVVFTCNGKTKTSSVDLQTRDPQWNEIFEFDAMEEPPSVLDVEVFDFDGPFDLATSLGHSEINFLTHSSTDLAVMWVSLEGKLAQTSQSKLHLRIFLDNNNGIETMKEYLTKMEKKVGKKLSLRSPRRNSAFQKLFRLPPEEFLMSDFSCCLKRKLPLQGRIYLSARIVGFYANLFGHKTKFFFLWEDIEDIQIFPASLPSLGSPSLVIILRKGRGLDARHGAKSQDEEGRLGYYFQSFASFNVASRTIMALWRTRTLTPEERAQIANEQQDEEESSIGVQDAGSFLFEVEDAKMSKVYAAEFPMNIKSLMEIFNGGVMEHKIMEKSGCLNYAATDWEPVKPGVLERCLSYKFNRHVSIFGVEVTCTQHKSSMTSDEGYIVDEVMVLHDIPFGDHFHVHLRYQIEKSALAGNVCKCDVFIGINWLKSTKFQQRITRNIIEKFTHRVKEIFELVEKEILFATRQDSSI